MIVDVKFKMEIEEDFFEELTRIADHHIDRLIDVDSYPEIKSVSNVMLIVDSGKESLEDGKE